jgi:CBS domain containing-hemolysin-like protein
MLAVRDANRKLKLDLPRIAYTTMAGFLLTLGRLPQSGETTEYEGWKFTVERIEERRIRRIRLQRTGTPHRAP